MHLLLVQFEHDSTREEEEQGLDRQEKQELDSDSDRIHFAQDSNSTNGSKSRSNSLASLSSVALSNGVRVSPSSSSGSASGGIGNGWFGGGSLSFGAGASGSSSKSYVDDFGGRSGEEAEAGSDSLSWQAFSPPLPPPPSAFADTAVVNGRRSLGEMEGMVEARPRDVVGDGADKKTARSLARRVSMISSGAFSHPVALWGGGEGGGAGDIAAREGGNISSHVSSFVCSFCFDFSLKLWGKVSWVGNILRSVTLTASSDRFCLTKGRRGDIKYHPRGGNPSTKIVRREE